MASRDLDITAMPVIDEILNRTHPPVGKFRLISSGFKGRMLPGDTADSLGSAACISCGNCVDACPVVAAKGVPLPMRTSMALETMVADECLRCYRCIQACPQVDPPLKARARQHRWPAILVHAIVGTTVPLLALSGILMYHWGQDMPVSLYRLLGVLHRVLSPLLLATPLMLLFMDPRRFFEAVRAALLWNRDDLEWLRQGWQWLISGGRKARPKTGYLNPAQRGWYLWVFIMLIGLGGSGIAIWLNSSHKPGLPLTPAAAVHVGLAMITDMLVVLHIVNKLVYPLWRDWRRTFAKGAGR